MAIDSFHLFGSFLIGAFGSFIYLFMLWSSFKNVPLFGDKEKLVSTKNVVPSLLYACLGGGIALILQIDSETWSAFYALMLGLSWPGMMAGYLGSKEGSEGRELLDRNPELQDKLGLLTGEENE